MTDVSATNGKAPSNTGAPMNRPRSTPTNGIVIGAMKSGTTTLYHDLRRFPSIDLPDKELDFFQRPADEVTTTAYRALFRSDAPDVACRLDISTTYSMWPQIPDVPERAAEVLGGEARLVYLVRDPVERAISHHHHMVARGATTLGFAEYLADDPGVIGFGRYDQQAARWTEQFGEDALLVVRLEDYASDWATVAPKILAHLGVDPDLGTLEPPAKENATDEARVFTGTSRRVAENPVVRFVYRNGIRRVLSPEVRTAIRNRILPAPPERPAGPAPAVLSSLVDQLQPAADYVAAVTDTEPWDLAASAGQVAS
ncbi:MAG: sulfotransferase [Actinomycetota bacterium]